MIVAKEKCHICGKISDFQVSKNATLYRDAVCSNCGATIRTSDIAKAILDEYCAEYESLKEVGEKLPVDTILNASTSGYIHEYLKFYPQYISGEYFDSVESGRYKNGILCIDLCNIPFNNNSIDLLITEDVFEHVNDYGKAFDEVYRVLKPNATHIFTVPMHENKKTISRLNNPRKIYHGDPIRPREGCLVCTDFGNDLQDILVEHGFCSKVIIGHKFYEENEITDVDATYDEYLQKTHKLEEYFKYNSIVIVSRKVETSDMEVESEYVCDNCFEALIDNGKIGFELLHRYCAISKLVRGKNVLDIEYRGKIEGAKLLSSVAQNVTMVSIDENVANYMKAKYKTNKSFTFSLGTMDDLGFIKENNEDVVISFEAIEYLNEVGQKKLLEEVKRVLKPEGLFIISTPNKAEYLDRFCYSDRLHVREFYIDEFIKIVSEHFKNVSLYRQFLEVASFIEKEDTCNDNIQYVLNNKNHASHPQYVIIVASDGLFPTEKLSSVSMSENEEYYSLFRRIKDYKKQVSQLDNRIELQDAELERRARELNNRMDKINELFGQVQELTNLNKLQKEELERRAIELENRMDVINEIRRQKEDADYVIKLQNEQLQNKVIKDNQLGIKRRIIFKRNKK